MNTDDIFKILNLNEIFSTDEMNQLIKTMEEIMKTYIISNIDNIIYPNFDKNVINYTFQIFANQLLPLYNQDLKFIIEFKLMNIIRNIKNKIYSTIIPRRSYNYSFTRNIVFNLDYLRDKINILEKIYQPTQRTKEWYVFRHNLLTASSMWKALSTQSAQNQLIYEKCSPYTEYKQPLLSSPLHWGQKYEPISIQFYEKFYETKIMEFGCIKHQTHEYIGASPDGVNIDESNPRFGRMLEIKNVFSRVINGIPKMEYWIQMQIQMETCNLNECDFLETKFIEYECEEEFYNDGTFNYSNDNKVKGIIILFCYEQKFYYEYPDISFSKEEFLNWETEILQKNSHMIWMQNIYWKLQEYSNILVLRNKLWFNSILPSISKIWDIICYEKINGYDHRAPTKRKRSTNNNNTIFNSKKCFIPL